MSDTPLWVPSSPETTQLAQFMRNSGHHGLDYTSFWQWSVEHPEKFWDSVWDFAQIIGDKGDVVLESGDDVLHAKFFPHARLNYAENLLKRRDNTPAMIFRDEQGRERTLTFNELYESVARWQAQLKAWGVGRGDRAGAGFSCPFRYEL